MSGTRLIRKGDFMDRMIFALEKIIVVVHLDKLDFAKENIIIASYFSLDRRNFQPSIEKYTLRFPQKFMQLICLVF